MFNKLTSFAVLILFVGVGVFAIVNPLKVWDIFWGWWLGRVGDVSEKHRVYLIRAMGVFYLLLIALFVHDLIARLK